MANSTEGISVTICTFNGKNKLEKTLEHLAKQIVDVPVEIILIDNASTDNTKSFADSYWLAQGNSTFMYHSYLQPIPGKSFAQDLAYDKAKHEYIVVCDDDNWLDQNYLQLAFDLMEANKEIGALGGQSVASLEGVKPSWFDEVEQYYAVGQQAASSGEILQGQGTLYGAGMVIRKSHWLELKNKGFDHQLTCRKGNTLSSGGDAEYCYALRLLVYKIWYDERLKFTHFMPQGRLNLDYLLKMKKGMSKNILVIRAYRDVLEGRQVNRFSFFLFFLNALRIGFLKNTYRSAFGNLKQRLMAKDYFAYLRLLMTSYQQYHASKVAILEWMSSLEGSR